MSKLLLVAFALLVTLALAEDSKQFSIVPQLGVGWDPRFPEPCYPGPCPTGQWSPYIQAPSYSFMSLEPVQITRQQTKVRDPCQKSSCKKKEPTALPVDVEVKVSNGGYAGISLPPPPKPDLSLVETKAETKCPCTGQAGCACVAIPPIVVAPDPTLSDAQEQDFRSQITRSELESRAISGKINKKEKSLDEQNQWLENAQKAMMRLQRQMSKVNQTKSDIEDELEDLRAQKVGLRKSLQRTVLERDLALARESLSQLQQRESGIKGTKGTIGADANRVNARIQQLHDRLNKAIKNYSLLQGGTQTP